MNKFRMRLGMALGVVIIIAIGAVYWYFSVHGKTPQFALHSVFEAVEKHDEARFNRYVNIDRMLANSYDDLVAGMMESEHPLNEESQVVVADFLRMLKSPLITSFKTSLNHYVATGTWETVDDADNTFDAEQILARSGLKATALREVTDVDVNEADGLAIAHINVYQKEADGNFVLNVLLKRGTDGIWRIEQIQNFHDFVVFVNKARRDKMAKYAESSASIWTKHEENMRSADFEFKKIMAAGSLGQESTRMKLRDFMLDTVKKDWQERREELSLLSVPEAAASIQHLRLKICDLHIRYAEGYAEWMKDKKAATIREAESLLKQARTLEQEAEFLARRLKNAAATE